jgi:hypothetical protein
MAWMIDKLLDRPEKLDCSILEGQTRGYDWVSFLSEGDLRSLRHPRPRFFPHHPQTFGSQFHRASAYQLGKHAQSVGVGRKDAVIAVFFRDSDGTNSAPQNLWSAIFESIRAGFLLSGFPSGVPMVPRPKSEAWMLCGLLKANDPTHDCAWLEEEPGNDASPRSLKRQLALHFDHAPDATEQAALVAEGRIDPQLIDLTSFIAFREELDRAYAEAVPPPH